MLKHKWLWVLLIPVLLFPLFSHAEAAYEDLSFPENTDYIDMGSTVVRDFDAFADFLEQFPNLRQVDMWENHMTAAQCDFLAARFPQVRWGWTMIIKNEEHEHLVRTDYTSWSTLHNNKSTKHNSRDFAVLKYCWNLKALDVGHNNVTSVDFLYDLPNLRILILACNAVEDITPIASLKHLEYLELFKNKIRDVSPLQDLPHLMDLNICFNRIADLSPLQKLPSLKKLWCYSCLQVNTVPDREQTDALRAVFPDIQMDTTHYSTAGGWRFSYADRRTPHYEIVVQNFGAHHQDPRTEYVPFEDSWPEDDEPAD